MASRHLILELLLVLFELYPPSALPFVGGGASQAISYGHARTLSAPWEASTSMAVTSNLIRLPAPHMSLFSFIKSLLLTPAPPPAEQTSPTIEPHEFIENLHLPRIYKAYLEELSNVCRDYFWVFCHGKNTIWALDQVDEGMVQQPRAPGGMTGGVEFEAMTYMTSHFKFLNALAEAAESQRLPPNDSHSSVRFHTDMFLSGIERIIVMARKASTAYYPTLHLELARYVAAASRSGFELPWATSRLIGAPPPNMCKQIPTLVGRPSRPQTPSNVRSGSASVPSSPTKRSTTPAAHPMPGARKVTPMFG